MTMNEENLLEEGDSFDPQHQLLKAFHDQDLETFKTILTQGVRDCSIDPNFWYEAPNYGTLLDLFHRDGTHIREYEYVLLKAGGDTYAPNKKNDEYFIYAIESKNLELFEVILSNSSSDPNVCDSNGNWLLHLASEMQDTRFLEKLLAHRPNMFSPKIDLDRLNGRGQTALHVEAQKKNEYSSMMLLNAGIDLDALRDEDGNSGRDMLLLHLPHSGIDPNRTILQYACERGLHDVVDSYLKNGGNPNEVGKRNKQLPLTIAGFRGYSKIIRILTENRNTKYTLDKDGNSIYHNVLEGMCEYDGPVENIEENRDYYECLRLLIKVPLLRLYINCQNNQGNTPLHYAVKNGEPKVILLLLSSGANVSLKNRDGESALADISPRILEKYLDSCLESNDPSYKNDHYISFSYRCIEPIRIRGSNNLHSSQAELEVESSKENHANPETKPSETDILLEIAHTPTFRHLLKHPILSCFIYLRWQRIKRFFWLNLAFYLVFCILLNIYIIQMHSSRTRSYVNSSHSNNSTIVPEDFENSSGEVSVFKWLWLTVVIIILFMLIVRETLQFLISPSKYLCSPDNWLEAGIILSTTSILSGNELLIQKISPIAILLSWAALVLLIGRYPFMATHIEMFKTVSWNFLELFSWYSILIIAFSLSFYVLFGDNEDATLFSNPWISTFKTVIMITGEFDSSSLGFNDNPIVSHVVFVSFVFLIAIVLFNLLNGLAVSDIQAIKSDAEVVSSATQVKLISYLEKIILGDPDSYKGMLTKVKSLSLCLPYLFRLFIRLGFFKKFSMQSKRFSFLNSTYNFRIYPNQKNRVEYQNVVGYVYDRNNDHYDNCENDLNTYDYYERIHDRLYPRATHVYSLSDLVDIDPFIVKAARQIIINRRDEENDIQKKTYKILFDKMRLLHEYKHQLDAVKSISEETLIHLSDMRRISDERRDQMEDIKSRYEDTLIHLNDMRRILDEKRSQIDFINRSSEETKSMLQELLDLTKRNK